MDEKSSLRNRLKFLTIIFSIIGIIAIIVLNFDRIFSWLGWLVGVFSPLILGGCIAFVLNILMHSLERRVFKFIKKESLRKTISLVTAFILLIILVIAIIAIAVPELIRSIELLTDSLPRAYENFKTLIYNYAKDNPQLEDFIKNLTKETDSIQSIITNFLKNDLPRTLTTTVSFASHTFGMVFSWVIGFMFSIYVLTYEEKLGRQARQLVFTYLPENRANQVLYICHLTSKNFKAFIYGQVLEAIILFIMYIAVATIFRLPYSFMIATMIGVFSLIPLFGGYIGWAIGIFLILPINPLQALYFTIIFFVISQVEGNFIYPRIVGNSIGLPGIWVLAAVTVGGNMYGIIGMIAAVPIAALFYTLISENSQKRLRGKKRLIKRILNKPNWENYNPETDKFEDKPVHLKNVLEDIDEANNDDTFLNGNL